MIKYALICLLLPIAAIGQIQNPSFEQSDSLGNTIHWKLSQGKATRWSVRSFNGIPFTAANGNFFIELTSDTQTAIVKHALLKQSFPVSTIDKSISTQFMLLTSDTSVYAGITYIATKWNGTKRDTLAQLIQPIKAVLNGNFIALQWNTLSVNIPSSSQPDSVHIEITNALNASGFKTAQLFIDNVVLKPWSVSVPELPNALAVSVYPNPATDYVSIAAANNFSQVRIFNQLGQQIEKFEIDNQQTFSIAHLPNGLYYLVLKNEATSNTISLSVQH